MADMVLVLVHVPGDAADEEMNVTTLTAVSDGRKLLESL